MKFEKLPALFIFFLLFSFAAPSPSFADKKSNYGIRNFWEVEPGLYRGAQPNKQGYETLKKLGVKTVVSFRRDRSVKKEKAWAEKEGIRFISIPWVARDHYAPQDLRAFLEIAGNSKNRPLFVHCKAGKDRTGLMMASYRMYHDGWSEKDAFAEMKRLGYHRTLYPHLRGDLHKFAREIKKDSKGDLFGFLYSHNPVFILRDLGLGLWNGFVSIMPASA